MNTRATWERNAKDYGYYVNVDGVHADVNYAKERHGRQIEDTIRANVHTLIGERLDVSKSGFANIADAQGWCERWIRYVLENKRLQAEVEHYRKCLREVSQREQELLAKLNEIEWQKVREKFGWAGDKQKESKS